MEGGRVNHSWCMCVVVMAMVDWMGAGMELVLGKHAGQSQVVGRMSGICTYVVCTTVLYIYNTYYVYICT